MMRNRITAAQVDAIAERVYLVQEAYGRRHVAKPEPIKPWAKMSAAERHPWRDGVRLYLGAAMVVGWRGPESEAARARGTSPGRETHLTGLAQGLCEDGRILAGEGCGARGLGVARCSDR
jgi:hypothetical protein